MAKINFKQPKYIFPAVVFVPLCFLAYFVVDLIGGDDSEPVKTDEINANLPEPNTDGIKDKYSLMDNRYDDEEAYTAVGSLGQEEEQRDTIGSAYTDSELDRLDAEEAERIRRRKEVEEIQRSLMESRRRVNSASSDYESPSGNNYDSFSRDMEEVERVSRERQQFLHKAFGIGKDEEAERENKRRQDSIQREQKLEYERNRPNLVIKTRDSNAFRFNSVTNDRENIEAPLIRAMIDQTTKVHEGTRIRFKLLDNVTIKDVQLPRGTYLYGTVSGFGQQRVKAEISSILIGNKFVKVSLSVYDNDGMEGFYVPESAFRDFIKDAGSKTIQQNMQFDTNSGSTGISGEAIALQALQNVYNSATSAISANIKKNRAKIKYSTIVYLINSSEAR